MSTRVTFVDTMDAEALLLESWTDSLPRKGEAVELRSGRYRVVDVLHVYLELQHTAVYLSRIPDPREVAHLPAASVEDAEAAAIAAAPRPVGTNPVCPLGHHTLTASCAARREGCGCVCDHCLADRKAFETRVTGGVNPPTGP